MLVIVMAMALAGAEPAAAPTPATTAPAAAAPAPAKPPKKKLVCVEEPQMGSLFKQKTCATQEEWDRRRDKDQEAMSRGTGRSSSCTGETC